tara:strand:- start:398 stop:1030 length:633 start_codon:yes stop_codon:yes gene_type:complete
MSYDYVYKLILAGSVGVGKTSLIQKITTSEFNPHTYTPTIGIEFCSTILNIHDKKIKCRIWDTAGQETYNSLINIYFRDITGAILVFDSSKPESLEDICNIWIPQINKNNIIKKPKLILVENKSDLKRNINPKRLDDIIESFDMLYIKTSVLHNTNTSGVLYKLCENIDKNTNYNNHDCLMNSHISPGYKNVSKPFEKQEKDRDYCCCIM